MPVKHTKNQETQCPPHEIGQLTELLDPTHTEKMNEVTDNHSVPCDIPNLNNRQHEEMPQTVF